MANTGLTPSSLDPFDPPGPDPHEPSHTASRARDASQAIDDLRACSNDARKDLDMLLSGITVVALELTHASGAALALRTYGTFVCRASAGETAPPPGTQLDANSGISGECVRTGVAQLCSDVMRDPRVDAEASQSLGIRSLAAVPLHDESGVIGILEVFAAHPHAFTDAHFALLNQLADVAVFGRHRRAEPQIAPRADHQPSVQAQRVESAKNENYGYANEAQAEGEQAPISSLIPDPPSQAPIASGLTPQSHERRSNFPRVAALAGVAILIAITWIALVAFRTSRSSAGLGKANSVGSDSGNVVSASPASLSSSPMGILAPGGLTGTHEKPSATIGPAANDLVERASSTAPLHRAPLVVASGNLARPVTKNSGAADDSPLPGATQSFPNSTNSGQPPAVIAMTSVPLPLGPLAVSQGVTGGTLIHRVTPIYPKRALDDQIAGAVMLQGVVGEDGALHEVQVLSGDPRLAPAARQAVVQWRYTPFQLNGKPVAMRTNITVQFKLP